MHQTSIDQQALALVNQGKLLEAETIYRNLIAKGERNCSVISNLAAICGMQGKFDELINLLKEVISLNPSDPYSYANLGIAFQKLGDLNAAIAAYKKAVELNQNDPNAHLNLGNAFKEQGNLEAAIKSYTEATFLNPNDPYSFFILGIALQEQGDTSAAIDSYNTSLQHNQNIPEVHNNLGIALNQQGNLAAAISSFTTALELNPNYPEAHNNLGNALEENLDLAAAIISYNKALDLKPNYPEAHYNLGNAFKKQGDQFAAIASYNKALELQPSHLNALNNLGNVLMEQGDIQAAIASYRNALLIDSNWIDSRKNIAKAFLKIKAHEEALKQFEKLANLRLNAQDYVIALQGRIICLLELDRYEDAINLADKCSKDRRLRLMARLHVLPVLYHSEEQLFEVRQRYFQDLSDLYPLLADLDKNDSVWPYLYEHTWLLSGFYLAYQMADDKLFQEIYAGILDRILRPKLNRFMQDINYFNHADGSAVRIGVISPHLRNHNGSIWAFGWFDGISNSADYKIFCYNIGEEEDLGTSRFANLGTYRHLHLTSCNPELQLQHIIDDKLDLLIFTDVGMHPASKITSVLQLATVQVQGWGHPVTSGSKTMKYFFGSEGMDTIENQAHYSEQLIRLPGIGLNYPTPIAFHDGTILFDKFNLPTNRPLILSLQSTFKYVPRNDWIFAELAYRNKNAFILLVGSMENTIITEILISRLRPHFEQRELDIEQHLRILPQLDSADYTGMFLIANHSIDTIDWNGGNSSLQAFSQNCPVVSMPTGLMRGRHTLSMLLELDLKDLIASDRNSYVDISSRLINDIAFHQEIKEKIQSRKHLLFNDKRSADEIKKLINRIFLPSYTPDVKFIF